MHINVFVLAVLISGLAPLSASAQLNALPERLEMMGSKEQFLDWITTNAPVEYSIFLTAQRFDGYTITWLIPGAMKTFRSYAQFKEQMAVDGFRLYKDYFEPEKDSIATQIKLYCSLAINTPSGSVASIMFYDYVGSAYDITTNSFLSCPYRFLKAPLLISGLESFEVKVNRGTTYSYKWSTNGQHEVFIDPGMPKPPNEFTTNGVVVFNDWYSTGAQYTTFEISAGGKVRKYTAFGDAFDSSRLTMTSSGQIKARIPMGSEHLIQSSTNMIDWADMAETFRSWTPATRDYSHPAVMTNKCTFYRLRFL